MSKHSMISVKSAIKEYLRRTGHRNDFEKRDLMAFANDGAERINTDEQLVPKISLITIKDYKGKLEPGFRSVIQASYLNGEEINVTRGQVAEWSRDIFGSDCKLKTSVECPRCSKEVCNCSTAIMEFTPDEIWKTSNPGFFNAYQKHFVREVNMTKRGGRQDKSPFGNFRLMNYATDSFFNVPFHVNQCTNFNVNTKIEYTIHLPNIVVNFKQGVVLLSYFGKPVDEEGYLMIPNTSQSIKAVTQYMIEATSFIEYNRSREQKDRIFWQQMRELSEKEIARAVSENQMPSEEEFETFVSKFWHKILPQWNARENRYKGYDGTTYKYPRQMYNHKGYDEGRHGGGPGWSDHDLI